MKLTSADAWTWLLIAVAAQIAFADLLLLLEPYQ